MSDIKWTGLSWGIYNSNGTLIRAGFTTYNQAVEYLYGEGLW